MDTKSLVYTLLHLKGWGPKRVYDYVFKYNFNYEKAVEGLVKELSPEAKEEFKIKLSEAHQTIQKNKDQGVDCICILDKGFHFNLYSKDDVCVFLFYKGDISLLNNKCITIVGTRKPEEPFITRGIEATKYFAKRGYVIVSGLALGCDTIAHKACIEAGGKTIAVLPSPCDSVQPTSNKRLAEDIVASGGLLISEYGTGDKMSRFNYPRRDRIQSLLSRVIVIIQATNESGTMIAASKNIKDRKRVFALRGNNLRLISDYFDVDNLKELDYIENSL